MEQALYIGSTTWLDDIRKARANFRVTHLVRRPCPEVRPEFDDPRKSEMSESLPAAEIVEVNAEAGTGSRYFVVATPLSPLGRGVGGGPVLVTVLWPWQDSWCLQYGGTLALSYVAEHLTVGRYRTDRLHGGDAAALTLTVATALGRYEDAALDA